MSNPTTLIPFLESPLPTCIPNLMPFHVGYSGPAAVSAFMRVENYKEFIQEDNATKPAGLFTSVEVTMDASSSRKSLPNAQNSQLEATPSESSLTQVESQGTSECITPAESQSSGHSDSTLGKPSLTSPSDAPPELEDADKRFVSTFRGRSIHGLTIELPSGYSGVVLRTEERRHISRETQAERIDTKTNDRAKANLSKTKGKAKAAVAEPATRSRGRLTRSAAPKPTVITVEDDDDHTKEDNAFLPTNSTDDVPMEVVEDGPVTDQSQNRKLVPQAQFSSFTLWHADRPVDKGNDDYYRTLTEWISLSHEINRTDL